MVADDKDSVAFGHFIVRVLSVVGAIVVCCALIWLFVSPIYAVWAKGLQGQAELRRAESTRQILVQEAKAKLEASKLEAEAEIVRAEGLAKAITIVGEKAKEFPEYRYQHFIDGLTEALKEGLVDQVIYLPTEAGIPILESSRFHFHTNHKPAEAKITNTEKKIAE